MSETSGFSDHAELRRQPPALKTSKRFEGASGEWGVGCTFYYVLFVRMLFSYTFNSMMAGKYKLIKMICVCHSTSSCPLPLEKPRCPFLRVTQIMRVRERQVPALLT